MGLEQKVDSVSLIEVDRREQSSYLNELARGLRLGPDVCAEIHQHFGGPMYE